MKKKFIVFAVVFALTLSLSACGGEESSKDPDPVTNPTQGEEAPENSAPESPKDEDKDEVAYEVTYTSVKAHTDSIGSQWVQVIAEIENTGSCDLYLSSGSYDIEDAAGSLISSNSIVSIFPEVISPGEKAYMYEEDILDEAVNGELVVKPRLNAEEAKVENVRFPVSDLKISGDSYGGLKALGRVENTGENEEAMVYVVVILKDADGKPIGQIFTILDTLAAGDKVGFEQSSISLPDDVTMDTVASYEAFAYPMQFQF